MRYFWPSFLFIICFGISQGNVIPTTPKYNLPINRYKSNTVDKQNDNRTIFNKKYMKGTPPHYKEYVAMARYIIHQADWTSIATTSAIPAIKTFPFTSIVSMSDGTVEKSVGIPYFYLTPLDYPSIDLAFDNRCTVSATLEQTDYCRSHKYDPDDPRCARVMLSGRIIRLMKSDPDYGFAKEALFTRHPSMSRLPEDHGFYIAKLDIQHIAMLDWFGGPIYIPIDDYLSYNDTIVPHNRFILKKFGLKRLKKYKY